MRARQVGITIGVGEPGVYNAITDVAGVRVGYITLISGSGPLVVGHGPVRTGVTVVLPHGGRPSMEPAFAGYHRLNGFGELTGLERVHESGRDGLVLRGLNGEQLAEVLDRHGRRRYSLR